MTQKVMAPVAFSLLLGFALSSAFGLATEDQRDVHDDEAKRRLSQYDIHINQHAARMIDRGRQIFRFDTFGSEAFWGDTLRLHEAIAGNKNGGVGDGVSPTTALAVGLKVDVD